MRVTLLSTEQQLVDLLPASYEYVSLKNLSVGMCTNKYIKGIVQTSYSLKRNKAFCIKKINIIASDNDCAIPLSIFLRGVYAEECERLEVVPQDVIVLSDFEVESYTGLITDTAFYPVQVVVERTEQYEPYVWLIKHINVPNANACVNIPISSSGSDTVACKSPAKSPIVRSSISTRLQERLSNKRKTTYDEHFDKATAATCDDKAKPSISVVAENKKSNDPKKAKVSGSYTYVKLNEVHCNCRCVNLFGIVKYVKHPAKAKGSEWYMVISLVDPSLTDPDRQKLKCLLFAEKETMLPQVTDVGDIVRFHRLKIATFNGELQGQKGAGFSALIWDGNENGSMTPRSTTPNYSITDEDLQTVRELRRWYHNDSNVVSSLKQVEMQLSCVQINEYCNIVCQVVAKCNIKPGECVLHVWDGTKTAFHTRSENLLRQKDWVSDEELIKKVQEYGVDIYIFDEHCKSAESVKPGDFVKFINLHATQFKNPDGSGEFAVVPTIELVLHRGFSYGRSLKILSPNSDEVINLQRKLQQIVAEKEAEEPLSLVQLDSCDMANTAPSLSQNVLNNVSLFNIPDSQFYGLNNPDSYQPVTGEEKANSSLTNDLIKEIEAAPTSVAEQSLITIDNSSSLHVNNSQQYFSCCSSQDTSVESSHCSSKIEQTREVARVAAFQQSTLKCDMARLRGPVFHQVLKDSCKQSSQTSCAMSSEELANTTDSRELSEGADSAAVFSQSADNTVIEARCMLRTATVTLGHAKVHLSSLEQLLNGVVPNCYRVLCRLVSYSPSLTDSFSFIRLFCRSCHFMSGVPAHNLKLQNDILSQPVNEDSQSSSMRIDWWHTVKSQVINGRTMYACPKCSNPGLTKGFGTPQLLYIFQIQLMLADKSDSICANLHSIEAEKFFGARASDVIGNVPMLQELSQKFRSLFVDKVDVLNLEMCISSAYTESGVVYSVFDTRMAAE